MCILGVFNYDDHCTVVIVIHGRLFFHCENCVFHQTADRYDNLDLFPPSKTNTDPGHKSD
jgi:hypothetical protein